MRLLASIRTVMVLALLLTGCQTHRSEADEPSESVARSGAGTLPVSGEFSYVGKVGLKRGADPLYLSELLDLPATLEVRRAALDKLAAFLTTFITPSKTDPEIAALVRPLLEDALDVPSRGEAVQFSTKESAQWFYGFRLSDERAGIWQANLRKAAELADAKAVKALSGDGYSGWKLPLPNGNVFSLVRVGSWEVVTFGKHLPAKDVSFLAKLAKDRFDDQKGDHIVSLHLKQGTDWIDKGFLKDQKVSELNLLIHPQRGILRSDLRLNFEKGRQWTLEPWRIPTNTIQEPLIAFTAVQSLSNWFAAQKFIQTMHERPVPNQAFLWAQSVTMFSLFGAIRVPDNTNVLERFSKSVLPEWSTNLSKVYGGDFLWVTNLAGAFWHGLPAAVPFVRPGDEADRDVIMVGLFPTTKKSEPAPAELIAQVSGRTNLLYYDWEVMPPRVIQMDQLALMISELQWRAARPPERPAEKWLQTISTNLQNTITEATLVSPREVSIVRRSVIGLSSVELVALARWLEHPDFPRISPGFWLEPQKARGR